jgi:hypothetical protein
VLLSAGASGWIKYLRYRRLMSGRRIQPPPEVIAHHKAMQYPWAEGLDRQQRTEAFKAYARKIWESNSPEQLTEVADGFFPQATRRLNLRPDQVPRVRKVYNDAVEHLIPVWDGFWAKDFDRSRALVQTGLILAESRMRVQPVLDEKQRASLDQSLTRFKEDQTRQNAPAAVKK